MWCLQSFIFLLNKVAIHCANMIDLRIGGSGEMADIEIKPVSTLPICMVSLWVC